MTDRLDVLFVNPPSRVDVYQDLHRFAAIEPPVWAGLLARALDLAGWSVAILDAEAEGLSTSETAYRIAKAKPRLAVFCIYGHQPSASTQCMPAAKEVAEILSLATKEVPSLALGTHPSALPGRTLYDCFDYVCEGEGLYTIAPLLLALKSGANVARIPSHLRPPGLWSFSHGFGSVPLRSSPAPMISNLTEELPGQAWELLDMKRYRPHHWHAWSGKDQSYASVQTSLGCPFKCSFCCINAPFGKPAFRTWSASNIHQQVKHLVEAYGITNIKIPDEMFVLNPKHVRDLCEGFVAEGWGEVLNMWAYARIDTVNDPELLALMRKAGFRWLALGVESASKHVRDGVEKGRFGNEQIEGAIHRVRQAGIHIAANYIFGLPDDTLESMGETLDLACSINAEYANFYCAMAYPGSALHKLAQEKKWRLPEDHAPFDGMKPPLWSRPRGWIGYSQHSFDSLPLRTEALSSEEVLDFRDEAFITYHSRPEYLTMLDRTFGPRAPADVKEILALGKPKRRHRDPDPTLEFTKDIALD
jgi:anaerobic magnesium-protoporphyrin IX monomethyl ester cyclase